MPDFSPETTTKECCPSNPDSRMMSRHHWNETKITQHKINIHESKLKLNQLINKYNIKKENIEPKYGQGLIITRW